MAGEPTEGISKLASNLVKRPGCLISHEIEEAFEGSLIPLHHIRIITRIREYQGWSSGGDGDVSVATGIPLLSA